MIVILSGAADEPVGSLGDRSPLEAAELPNIHALTDLGRVGNVRLVGEGQSPEAGAALLALLGVDPASAGLGHAAIAGHVSGYSLAEGEVAAQLSLLSVGGVGDELEGCVRASGVVGLSDSETDALVQHVLHAAAAKEPRLFAGLNAVKLEGGIWLIVGRGALVDGANRSVSPAMLLSESWKRHVLSGDGWHAAMRCIAEVSAQCLDSHEINLARRDVGLEPANLLWAWGEGGLPPLGSFRDRTGMRGAMVTRDETGAAIAERLGLDVSMPRELENEEASFSEMAKEAIRASRSSDVVFVEVPGMQEAGMRGDAQARVRMLELADRWIIGPVLNELAQYGDPNDKPPGRGWRFAVVVDRYIVTEERKPDSGSTPFVLAGAWVRSAVKRSLIEREADESDLCIESGHELLEFVLKGGLARVRAR